MSEFKKIMIADDHNIISMGLYYVITRHFPNCNITEVNSLKTLIAGLAEDNFSHLILDLNLDDGNSLELIPGIIEQYPGLFILVYSMASEAVYASKLKQYNISGFLSKKSSEREIVSALNIFFEGGIYINRKLNKDTGYSDNEINNENVFSVLSVGELKVLGMILKGKKGKEIAADLNVKPQTIATFKSRIFKKLGTDNIFEIQKLSELNDISFT